MEYLLYMKYLGLPLGASDKVSDGSKVCFWHDVWCGDVPLKISYSGLFNIACSKDAWVVDNMQLQEGNIHWNDFFLDRYEIGSWIWSSHFLRCIHSE
jgi:hypothetical protein